MEELHATFSDKLTVDEGDPQLHLKLNWSLRSKLIKKLNEHSQFGLLIKDEDRMKTMEENNRIIASLDSLPVLIEDGKSRSPLLFCSRLMSFRFRPVKLSCFPYTNRLRFPFEQTGQNPS